MERLFLLEATTPGQRSCIATDNRKAMRLMRQVIENWLKSPGGYGARGTQIETDVIEMGNQFAGFSGYPTLDGDMACNLALFLRIASNSNNRRQATSVQMSRTPSPSPTPTSRLGEPPPLHPLAHGSGS